MGYVEINGIDIFEKYKAPLAEHHSVQPPVLKSFFQDVPGADGSLDLSATIAGRPTYERRLITMNFNSVHRADQWAIVVSNILKDFHGKQGKIIFVDDPDYYYIGRMEVSEYERTRDVGKFTITANADPYKYELISSLEEWIWDPFNFETGAIRSYKNLLVNGEYTLEIPGATKWVIPEFTVKGIIKLIFEEKEYSLKEGTTKIYSVVIKEGLNTLVFMGEGTVSVNYRGGIL